MTRCVGLKKIKEKNIFKINKINDQLRTFIKTKQLTCVGKNKG
jgi:hypothetical protein